MTNITFTRYSRFYYRTLHARVRLADSGNLDILIFQLTHGFCLLFEDLLSQELLTNNV